MYRNQGMQLKALLIGKEALSYENSETLKREAIKKYITETESLISSLDSINFRTVKNVHAINDNYISLCINGLIQIRDNTKKSLNIFEELLICPLKYEGIFLNWIRAYKLNKIREQKYKILQECYEDKQDRNHPLFYYKIFKEYLDYIIKVKDYYLNINIEKLWNCFGKEYGNISIKDSFFIIKAKSYLRSNICKSVKKIKYAYNQENSHIVIKYFYVKYKIELIKFNQEVSKQKISKIFKGVNELCSAGLSEKHMAKMLYLLSELYFIHQAYDKSLELYKESKILFTSQTSQYLNNKSRLLTEKFLEDKVKYSQNCKKLSK